MLVIWLAVNDHTLKDHTKTYSCRRAENKTVFHVPNKGNNIHLGNTKGMKKHLTALNRSNLLLKGYKF